MYKTINNEELVPRKCTSSCLLENITGYTQQVLWFLPLVDYNGLLTVIVIPDTILFPEAGIILLSTHHMAQSYPINIKSMECCQAIFHHNQLILRYRSNSQFNITIPITNTPSNIPSVTMSAPLQAL